LDHIPNQQNQGIPILDSWYTCQRWIDKFDINDVKYICDQGKKGFKENSLITSPPKIKKQRSFPGKG
jgi:hypothetical protein